MPKLNNQSLERKKLETSFENNFFDYYEPKTTKRNYRKIPLKNHYTSSLKSNSNSKINSSYIHRNDYNRNNSRLSTFTEGNIKPNSNVIQNLQNTLKITERIKNKYLNHNKSFNRKKKLLHNKDTHPSGSKSFYNYNVKYKNYLKDNYNINMEKDDYDYNIDFDNTDYDYDYNSYYNYSLENERENKININKYDINKLNNKRSQLMQYNIEIRKENRILEKEINNYIKQFYYQKNLNNYLNYNDTSNKIFDKYKTALQSSINNNTNILDKIFKIQEINININNRKNEIYSKHKNVLQQLENYNRQNAEIQILNEENDNQNNELKEKNELFLDEIKRLKFELIEMKNNEKNLKILKY